MFFYVIFVCFLISTVQVEAKSKIKIPSWEDCGGRDAIIKVHKIDLDNPIRIGREDPIRISVNATQATPISGDSVVTIKINKNLRVLGQNLPIWVPCLNGIGSCTMTLCEIFKIHRKLVCAILESANQECKCPSEPGDYVANVNYQLNFGLFPPALLAIGNVSKKKC